jgi:hypothetical protein
MFHAESKNLRSKLQKKQTKIVTQISVLKEETAEIQLSKMKESNLKKKLYSLIFPSLQHQLLAIRMIARKNSMI